MAPFVSGQSSGPSCAARPRQERHVVALTSPRQRARPETASGTRPRVVAAKPEGDAEALEARKEKRLSRLDW